MKIEKHGNTHKNYIEFIIMGLKSYERANNVIEKIDVFNSAFEVTYKREIQNPSKMLNIHSHIEDYGLNSFFSIANMKEGNTVMYQLED